MLLLSSCECPFSEAGVPARSNSQEWHSIPTRTGMSGHVVEMSAPLVTPYDPDQCGVVRSLETLKPGQGELSVSGMPSLSELRRRIGLAMQADQHGLRRMLASIEQAQRSRQAFDRNLKRFQEALDKSQAVFERRAAQVPKVALNPDLPVTAKQAEIAAAIRDHQVVIVCGETGSGKSTQLPLICLQAGRGVRGLIGHTQPRRIAARSVATRVAEELKSAVGQAVGFKIRFTDATGPNTFIKLMTDGILLAESQNDRYFDQYDTLIIDEAHERSLNVDFLLGRLKQILPKRPDLRVIITSATIDATRFAEHFGTMATVTAEDGSVQGQLRPAPIVEVSGRTYPVEILYRPLLVDEERDEGDAPRRRGEADLQRSILDAVDECCRIGHGDILIFLPTERDIHDTARSLRGRLLSGGRREGTEILPLYARLSTKDQNRIFQTSSQRRIVIATNVAESSLTVPGIRFVIDTGTARVSRYSSRSRMQRLPIEAISRASADQRAGRCGRVGPGVCLRLYAVEDYLARDRFTVPEIQRTNLASVILQTHALKLGTLEEFPFLDPPKAGTIADGYRLLFELGALDERNELTETGRQLARLPVDPRVGRIILAADAEGCLTEMLIIASLLETQDPRERPLEHQQAADEAHAKFQDPGSDFLSILKLWDFFHNLQDDLSKSRLRKACQQNFLSFNRLREWADIHRQIRELVEEAGYQPRRRGENNSDAIHRALLAGFLSNIALLSDPQRGEYTAAGNQKVSLWPGSGLFKDKPKWVVGAELVETTKRYVRTIGRIKPEWIEALAGHLIERSYSDPEWDGEAGSAMAFEKATLFGLPIIPRRRVRYSAIKPDVSRQLLIEQGLVGGDIRCELPFFVHNQRLLEELQGLQSRTRRSDLIVDDEVRIAFYEQRIPPDVSDLHRLARWLSGAEKKRPRLLHMTKDDLRRPDTSVAESDFPDRIRIEQMDLPLEYHLEPGSPEDGVTLAIPKEALNQLDQKRLGWLVPGLIEEKIVALIRSLPKDKRRHFVPANETARAVIGKLTFGAGDFEALVARLLTEMSRESITVADFQMDRLPGHLRMNVRVLDDRGEALASGRDILELKKQLGSAASASFTKIDEQRWHRDGLTAWNFGDLPASIPLKRNGIALTGYPALLDRGESVSLRLLDLPAKAAIETRAGIRRLAALALHRSIKTQLDHLPHMNDWVMLSAAMGGGSVFRSSLGDLIVDRAFFPEKGPYPRTEAEFQERLKKAKGLIGIATQDVQALLTPLMEAYRNVRKTLVEAKTPLTVYAVEDARQQVAELTRPGFLTAAAWGWLCQSPRYLNAVVLRLQKVKTGLARDRRSFEIIAPLVQKWRLRLSEHQARELFDPELEHYRWMLEELRVSLFAQELRTAIPVSEARLEEQWKKVRE